MPASSRRWPCLRGRPPSLSTFKIRGGKCLRTPWGGRGGIPPSVCFWGFIGFEEGDGQEILHTLPQPHVGVRQVYLTEVYWPKMRVGSDYLLEDELERTPKHITSMGGKCFEMSLSPLNVKSKIRCGLLPTWGMTVTRESHMLWRGLNTSKG